MKTPLTYLALQDIKITMMGVIKKIFNQAKAMRKLFPDFECFIIGNHDKTLLEQLPHEDFIHPISFTLKASSKIGRLKETRKVGTEIAYELFKTNSPEFLYFRYPLGCPWTLSLFKRLTSLGIKIITEHQSIEKKELLALKKYLFWISESVFGRICLAKNYGVVGVTDEITDFQKHRARNAKVLTIPNGIDSSNFSFRNPNYADPQKRLDMLFIGSLSKWHGLDRLIKGMTGYKNNCFFHIVGEGKEKENLRHLAGSLGLAENVLFYGFRDKEQLDIFFEKCHIAIGSLGVHRNSLTQASPLKVREYAARGIPSVISYEDPDFRHVPWVFKANDPSNQPIFLKPIIDWSIECLYRHSPQKIHEYAVKHLDYDVKFKKLLCLME